MVRERRPPPERRRRRDAADQPAPEGAGRGRGRRSIRPRRPGRARRRAAQARRQRRREPAGSARRSAAGWRGWSRAPTRASSCTTRSPVTSSPASRSRRRPSRSRSTRPGSTTARTARPGPGSCPDFEPVLVPDAEYLDVAASVRVRTAAPGFVELMEPLRDVRDRRTRNRRHALARRRLPPHPPRPDTASVVRRSTTSRPAEPVATGDRRRRRRDARRRLRPGQHHHLRRRLREHGTDGDERSASPSSAALELRTCDLLRAGVSDGPRATATTSTSRSSPATDQSAVVSVGRWLRHATAATAAEPSKPTGRWLSVRGAPDEPARPGDRGRAAAEEVLHRSAQPRASGRWSVGGRCLSCPMIETTPETDTAAAVLAAARDTRAIADREEARLLQRWRWTGRRCTRPTRSWRPRPWRPVRTARRGCRSRVRVRRGWRSSRSPSSPPRSACRPMRGSGTSATPSSSGTGCPRVWERVQTGGLRPWLAPADRREDPPPLHGRRGVRGPARRTDRAPDRPRPARPAGRRGDRPLHARRSRSAVASNTPTAATSPSSPGRCTPSTAPSRSTASSTSPTRWSSSTRSRRSPPS